jgi:hypothetical protein
MVLVDAHVHLYQCFNLARAFDAAAANFAAAARVLQGRRSPRYAGVLCLVETAGERFLEGMRTQRLGRVWRGRDGYWEIEKGCEPESLIARCGNTRLALIAGRQLVTRERLEVLALGTGAPLADGEPIDETLAAVRAAGAAAVLPWGVGKWLGARGAVVDRILADPQWSHVYLGDNGNRLALSPDPQRFATARRLGRAVLPGSDPLPLPGEEARVGAYGLAIDGDLDALRPAAALLASLHSGAPFVAFGRRSGVTDFVGKQLKLRLRSRRGEKARWAA